MNHVMSYFQEYALLVAVAIPILAIVGLNIYLWWEGERGTLLLPSSQGFPAVEMGERIEEEVPVGYEAARVATSAERVVADAVPANDVRVREAA